MRIPILLLWLAFLFPAATSAQGMKDPRSFDPTFTHVVYFWLNNPENPEERQHFETHLQTLFKASKHTRTNFLGTPPKATRDVVDDSFTYAMILTFESAEAQNAYQSEEAHLTFIEQTAHLLKRFVVYDAQGLHP